MNRRRNHVPLAMPARTGFRPRGCRAAAAAVFACGVAPAAAVCLVALAAANLWPAAAAEPAAGAVDKTVTLHVAKGGDDRWSGRLATPAADGSDGPFATLDRARRAVRGLKVSGTLPQPVRVEIQEGTFHLAEPLRFTPDDSGSPPEMSTWNEVLGPERAVIYAAAAGARPVISGGRRITGWTKGMVAGHEAWMTDLPEVRAGRWTFTQLWVNGQRAERPRLPRVGPGKTGRNASYRIDEPLGDVRHEGDVTEIMFVGQDEFRFAGDDLREFHNLADVEFVALHFWIASRIPFAAIDTAAKTAKLRWKSRMRLTDDFAKQGAPYYVENVREALDTPGQFYLDRVSGVLTYLPRPGEAIDTAEVIAPLLPQIMVAEGQPDRPVEWLRFQGLTFSHSEWVPDDEARTATPQAACHVPGAVLFAHARNCSLERSAVTHVGSYGVELSGSCSDLEILGNTITDLGAGGVKVWHGAEGAQSCRRVTIGDNEIADGGHREHQGVGMLIGRCSGIQVVHNQIHDFDYTGISVGWSWGYDEGGTYGNVIERNHVHDIGRGMLSDMGGIYTLGVSPGTRIRHNLFHDIVSRGYGGWGIYTDEGSSDILIESNLVYRTSSQAFNQHYGRDNVVRNNILAFGTNGLVARGRLEPHDSFTFTGNIVLADKDDEVFAGNWRQPRATIDRNLYFHMVRGAAATLDFAGRDFAGWQQRGLDRHSLVADPLMKDPLHGDFRLDPRSPAIETLGFVPWDYDNVGPRTPPGPASAPDAPPGQSRTEPVLAPQPAFQRFDDRRFLTDVGGDGSAEGDTGRSRVFNVLRYGAVGDDKTDNTEAFSACLKALVEAGGGRMVIPAGIYHGQIVIPPVAQGWVSIEIAGECEPIFRFGTIGTNSLPRQGTIVKGMAGRGPAVIRAEPSPGAYGDFSSVFVILKNLDVRTSDDPDIDGIDLHYAQQCKLENVFVNTGVYNVQASKPTHGTSGIITPAINNAARTILRNVVVTGYHSGIKVNEHTDGDNIVVASTINGLEFLKAHHASRFARVGAYRSTHHVTVAGKHGFSISQLNTEQPGVGQTDAANVWQTLVSDVHDPGNLGVADIDYWVVIGNDGARDTFVKNGGTFIRARRIGSGPVDTAGGSK